jgi:glycosyltransferase involved in cell wall biosynthesis
METPSVVVRGSATAEPITDGENGFLCEDTTESLYSVLRRALADPASTRRIGKTARTTIYFPGTNRRPRGGALRGTDRKMQIRQNLKRARRSAGTIFPQNVKIL